MDVRVRAAVLDDATALGAAMGGREVGERTFDEDGFLLPETVYEWPDLGVLVTGSRP